MTGTKKQSAASQNLQQTYPPTLLQSEEKTTWEKRFPIPGKRVMISPSSPRHYYITCREREQERACAPLNLARPTNYSSFVPRKVARAASSSFHHQHHLPFCILSVMNPRVCLRSVLTDAEASLGWAGLLCSLAACLPSVGCH